MRSRVRAAPMSSCRVSQSSTSSRRRPRGRGAGPALWFGGRGVSYAEFGARVNALARELISQGVGPNVAVGVAIDRSVELLVAIHAVVAAGGQYVPIATDAPPMGAVHAGDGRCVSGVGRRCGISRGFEARR